MALYAMGDFHLAHAVDKNQEIFGPEWTDYVRRIDENCRRLLTEDDTLVICGDHSWGRRMEECTQDLAYIEALPGRKILLRGNHDMFWEAKKTAALNKMFEGRLHFLQNNYYAYGDYALVGTKGYCWEGLDSIDHFLKIRKREVHRLRDSITQAKADGYERFIIFLHYPPTSIGEEASPFTELAEQCGAEKVIYAHCHGAPRWHDSLMGDVRGVDYRLVSSDYRQFVPDKILD
ncbi:MAG: metallophosphoesterase [Lachnospiraceae bacterium]|nr:metallophosphoesterase [Lachnospiraceae bacterium]